MAVVDVPLIGRLFADLAFAVLASEHCIKGLGRKAIFEFPLIYPSTLSVRVLAPTSRFCLTAKLSRSLGIIRPPFTYSLFALLPIGGIGMIPTQLR
jgi:hypothetical protein